jgi:hypothetical protein
MMENQPESIFEDFVAEVLADSDAPMDQLAERQVEMCDHLEDCYKQALLEGVTPEVAVEMTLAEFGSVLTVRRELQRQRRLAQAVRIGRLRWLSWNTVISAEICSGIALWSLAICGSFVTATGIWAKYLPDAPPGGPFLLGSASLLFLLAVILFGLYRPGHTGPRLTILRVYE